MCPLKLGRPPKGLKGGSITRQNHALQGLLYVLPSLPIHFFLATTFWFCLIPVIMFVLLEIAASMCQNTRSRYVDGYPSGTEVYQLQSPIKRTNMNKSFHDSDGDGLFCLRRRSLAHDDVSWKLCRKSSPRHRLLAARKELSCSCSRRLVLSNLRRTTWPKEVQEQRSSEFSQRRGVKVLATWVLL